MPAFLEAIFGNPFIAFMVLVGVVVLVHEAGHFIVGRLCGVGVEEFSIGFGPKAFGFTRGSTEYKICWLPLGGYVRFVGADPSQPVAAQQRSQALMHASVYKRMLISFAGPAANFILSFCIMTILAAVGSPKPPAIISVIPQTPAQRAGLQDGDEIIRMKEMPVKSWNDLNQIVRKHANQELPVVVRRNNQELSMVITPHEDEQRNVYGEKQKVGRIGVSQFLLTPRIVVPKDSAWSEAGFRTGDLIVSVGNESILYLHQLEPLLRKAQDSKSELTPIVLERGSAQDVAALQWSLKSKDKQQQSLSISLATLQAMLGEGVPVSTDLMLAAPADPSKMTAAQTAASQEWKSCGLVPGATVTQINQSQIMHSPVELSIAMERIQSGLLDGSHAPGQPLRISVGGIGWNGEKFSSECVISVREGKDVVQRTIATLTFPFSFLTSGVPVPPVMVRAEGPLAIIKEGFQATAEQMRTIYDAIARLVTGKIPLANLGGPISIAKVAGHAADGGFFVFVITISWMSINIGLFNLLPLPALDGGHLLLQFLEAAYGKPLPQRVQEGVQRLGMAFIVFLILLVFYNDISRLFQS